MQAQTRALEGAPEKGNWTAQIRDGEVIYRHRLGVETTETEFVAPGVDDSPSAPFR